MKKLLVLLMSAAMILALASCGDSEKNDPASKATSETSEASSNTSSEELPAEKLTDTEIAAILAEFAAINTAKNMNMTMEMTVDVAVSGMNYTTTTTGTTCYNTENQEYSSVSSSDSGKGVSTSTEYYKDGKLYTITSADGSVSGYYEESTFEEVMGEEDDSVPVSEEILKAASVKREEGTITITSAENDPATAAAIAEFFDSEESTELSGITLSVVVSSDYKLKSFSMAYATSSEEEGDMGYSVAMTFVSYGDTAVEVPVPDGLDVCIPYEEYAELMGEDEFYFDED